MNPARRREMVDREHPSLPIVGQCALLGVSRSSIYYRPEGASEEELSLMREIDRQYLETPFYGSRRMKAWLERQGIPVSRKRVQRLMRVMGLRAIYRRPPKLVLLSYQNTKSATALLVLRWAGHTYGSVLGRICL